MAGQQTDLEQLSAAELGDLARQALTALAAPRATRRPSPSCCR